MEKPRVIVYKCVVCSASFDNRQSLAAHCRIHKDVEFAELHVRLPKEKVEEFKEFCRSHNATTCHMVLTMIDAYVEGEKKGLIVIGGSNPAIVHLQQFFNTAPRGHGKYEVGDFAGAELTEAVSCKWVNPHEDVRGRIGFCRRFKRWVTPEICIGCVANKKA